VPDVVMRVAQLDDGRVAGYADLGEQDERRRFWIDLRVPPGPQAEEIAGALLDELEAHTASIAAAGATIRAVVSSPYELAARLLVNRGYEVFRQSFQMRIELDGELSQPQWPEGISVRYFVPGEDDEAVYEAQHEAFEDHFEATRQSYARWREWSFTESFDPSLWLLAVEDSEIVGVCLCRPEVGAGGELGFVDSLGVRRPWRRRGIARALLLHSFGEFRVRGKRGVALGVDGLNTTGAVQLYELAGMYVARRNDHYRKPVAA